MKIKKVRGKKVLKELKPSVKEIKKEQEEDEIEQEEIAEEDFSESSSSRRTAPVLQAGNASQSNLEATAQAAPSPVSNPSNEKLYATDYEGAKYTDAKYEPERQVANPSTSQEDRRGLREAFERRIQQAQPQREIEIQETWQQRQSSEGEKKYESVENKIKADDKKRRRMD